MTGLSNIYVNELGKILCGKKFVGVYSSDIQPKFEKRLCNFSIIFNTDKHTEKGTHFIAISCDKNNFFYFDPFGKKCRNKEINKFIKENLKGRAYIYNNKRIQNDKSLFCGLHCLSFLLSQNKKIPFSEYLKNFSKTKTFANDGVVTKIIENEFI